MGSKWTIAYSDMRGLKHMAYYHSMVLLHRTCLSLQTWMIIIVGTLMANIVKSRVSVGCHPIPLSSSSYLAGGELLTCHMRLSRAVTSGIS